MKMTKKTIRRIFPDISKRNRWYVTNPHLFFLFYSFFIYSPTVTSKKNFSFFFNIRKKERKKKVLKLLRFQMLENQTENFQCDSKTILPDMKIENELFILWRKPVLSCWKAYANTFFPSNWISKKRKEKKIITASGWIFWLILLFCFYRTFFANHY